MNPTDPVTGIQSTSGKITAIAIIAGILAVVLPHTQANQPSAEVLATTIVGGVTMLASIVAKLWHDVKVRSFAALSSDASSGAAALLPMIQSLTAEVQALKGTQGAQAPPPPPVA